VTAQDWLFPDWAPAESDGFHVPPAGDWVFASDNPLEIPTLRLDRMAMGMMAPVACWGSIGRRDTRNVRSWHFYTDDCRFEQLWRTPGDVVATGAEVCVEPNFSCLDDMPWPIGWYSLYRKRWIARWWQEQGIAIVADLFVGPKYREWNWVGLPKGWRSFATRGVGEDPEAAVELYAAARDWAGGEEIFFYVYGGGVRQAAALRAAGVPCVISDYYRTEDMSRWLQIQGVAGVIDTARGNHAGLRHGDGAALGDGVGMGGGTAA
jgi:hypothetical protein